MSGKSIRNVTFHKRPPILSAADLSYHVISKTKAIGELPQDQRKLIDLPPTGLQVHHRYLFQAIGS